MARVSSHIDRRQTENFLRAASFAAALNRPLNWYVTLNLAQAGCPIGEVSSAFERLRDNHFTRWLRYQSARTTHQGYGPPTYAWTIENVDHTHVNWLVHIPRPITKAFRKKLPVWVRTVSGDGELLSNMIHFEPIVGVTGISRYVLKGTDPRPAKKQRIDAEPQGLVTGKRCGISVCLGRAARDRYWTAMRDAAAA